MPLSNSRLAYADCLEFLDKALEGSRGARIIKGTFADASVYRMRCHKVRSIIREENCTIYPKGDPHHGVTPYDILVVRIREDTEGANWVYAEKSEQRPSDIEVLNDFDDIIEVEYSEVKQIEHQSEEETNGN